MSILPYVARWSLTLILFFVFALIVFYVMTRNRRVVLKICIWLFAFSAITGFTIHSIGYLSMDSSIGNIPLAALRAIFSTVRMFFINDDFGHIISSESTRWFTASIWLQIIYWICHVSAVIAIQAILISLFGRKAMDYFRLRFGSHKNVYIINSGNKNALLLGENIATHDGKLKQYDLQRLVVILPGEDDDIKNVYEKAEHFGGVVQVPDKNHELVYFLEKAGLGKRNQGGKKYNVILMPDGESIPEAVHTVADYAKEKGVEEKTLDIYALTSSEWDMEKVEIIMQTKENNGKKRKYPYTFHIMNERDMLIRHMVKNHPPFKCKGMKFNTVGEATRDFTVMVLGFGNIGQRVLLRLIMNGQFAGSRMRAIVMDKDLERLLFCFKHNYPEIEQCCEIIKPPDDFTIPCEKFYKFFNNVENVDYIVIALGNDKLNRKTLMDIHREYEKNGKELPNIAVCEKSIAMQKTKSDEMVFSFGCREEIYRDSVILREESDHLAKAVNTVYTDLYGGEPWHELDWIRQESNRASADYIDVMTGLAGVSEKELQSKIALINENNTGEPVMLTDDKKLAEVLAETEHLRWNAFHAVMGFKQISIEEMEFRFNNYKGDGNPLDYCRRDTEMRLHVCLAPWNELDKISEAYRELAKKTGTPKAEDFNFKDNDRDIVNNIPRFLHAANKALPE